VKPSEIGFRTWIQARVIPLGWNRDHFQERSLGTRRAWLLWILLAYQLLVAVDYQLKDADSSLYESISTYRIDRPARNRIGTVAPSTRLLARVSTLEP
jgi:hypothetical protein